MLEICFATNNQHKIKEVQALLPLSIKLLSLEEIGCLQELPETQNTIEGNSHQKAEFVFNNYKLNCFADDTGLEVQALKGKPGVLSSRYAGIPANPEKNIQKLLQELRNEVNRKARFKTVVTLLLNRNSKQFEGILNGKIIDNLRGDNGFGYDPVFLPAGFEITLGEMDSSLKNKVSHRGIAIGKLISFLSNIFPS
jgi:XTP/dITP diphosphohydrolase